LEPKVQAPYETRPGEVPRRIQVERKKRLFAKQKLEDLLLERGVDLSRPLKSALDHISPGLPPVAVEIFDDDGFEVRSPEAWLELGRASRAPVPGLPARSLFQSSDGSGAGRWRDCLVTGRDATTGLWEVRWSEGPSKERELQTAKHRVHICFRAEDPFNFADRVAAAHRRRAAAERALLHNLYVDCMPAEGTPELSGEEMGRIIALCMQSRAVDQAAADEDALMDEVNLEFMRAMNKMVL
ncbi:unnamed protein product, partial [Phaeothamnion confervicola]